MPVRRAFGAGRMPNLLLFIQRLTQRHKKGLSNFKFLNRVKKTGSLACGYDK
ncbi:MAG: hypothetical protein F6J90_31030 [Moorea sp. SIOASIH]|nr:hypothetical protein [Moorena sp. SIOASIH]